MAKQIIGHIEAYVIGDDFNDYIERMDSLIELNAIAEADQMRFCIGFCGADLYKIIKSCIAPAKITDTKYAEMKTKLKDYFEPKVNKTAERYKFYSRQQKEDETVSDYLVEIKALSQKCEFGDYLTQALCDKIVFGVNDPKIRSSLLREKNLDFDKACEMAKSIELANKHSEMMHDNTVSVFARNRLGPKVDNRADSGRKKSRFANYQCFSCGSYGHTSRQCRRNNSKVKNKSDGNFKRNKANGKIHDMKNDDVQSENDSNSEIDSNDEGEDLGIDFLNHMSGKGPQFIEVNVNNLKLKMEVDTGACQTVISESDKNKIFPNETIQHYSSSLKVVTGDPVKILGYINVTILNGTEKHNVKSVVIDTKKKFVPLVGRTWLDILYPGWRSFFLNRAKSTSQNDHTINVMSENHDTEKFVQNLVADYPNVFSTKATGAIKNFKIDINLKENAKPIFYKPYTMPYSLRDRTEKEINRLVSLGILYPVRHSNWATPIIPVEKPNNEIRICSDCKVTINKYLAKDHYPMPQIEDILANLAGSKIFCVLDLKEAFQQIEVSESSQEYLTINTHLGLFRYRRLVYGISMAPTYFQSVMDTILRGLHNTVCFIDDVLIGGKTLEEMINNLVAVIVRLNEYNVRVKLEKCQFFVDKVKYLGHEISQNGVQARKEKLQALLKAPKPENISQLRAYLGLVNYYRKFAPNLSNLLAPLYKLTKKDAKFEWSNECDEAFHNSKKLIVNDRLLVHYDPNKELAIHCDASPYGVGAILSHIIDGVDRPIMFASSSLTAAQKNYAQLHREALAIIFAVKKFHKYVYGKSFTIYSDHQPLREIFNENKSIPVANGRLQRWAIFLAAYEYKIVYKKGSKLGNADALSRLPLPLENDINHQSINTIGEQMYVNSEEIAMETKNDEILNQICIYVRNSWPNQMNDEISKYFHKKLLLTIENDCLYYGSRVVVPTKLRHRILECLHETHTGIVRMKMQTKHLFWWPNIDKDIENHSKCCVTCQGHQNTPSQVKLSKWNPTTHFFERIHLDFGQLGSAKMLIIVDTYSRWIDIKLMTQTTSKKLIEVLANIFSYFGLPHTIVADNGPPFNSKEFKKFCANRKIEYKNSPPYHPQSNGWAECAVRTVKMSLRKMLTDSKTKDLTLQQKIDKFLFKYRNTPVTTTKNSPNDLIFSYRNRTPISILNDKTPTKEHHTRQTNITPARENKNTKIFKKKEHVLYRAEANTKIKWMRAVIVEQLSTCRYKIRLLTNDTIRVCHGDQLRSFNTVEHAAKGCITHTPSNSEENVVSNTQTNNDTDRTSTPIIRASERIQNKARPNYHEPRVRKIKRKVTRIRSRSAGELASAISRHIPVSPPN